MKGSFAERIERAIVGREQQVLNVFFRLTTSYPRAVLVCSVVIAVLAVLYTVKHLELITGRIDMISSKKRYVQLDELYSNEFAGIDPMIVVVEPRDVPQGKQFVSQLGEVLKNDTVHVDEVFYRIDTASLEGKKLLYLSADDLRTLEENVDENKDLIRDLTTRPGINTLFRAINTQVSSAMVSHLVSGLLGIEQDEETKGEQGEKKPIKISFLNSLLQELGQALESAEYGYHSPWAEFFGKKDELSDDGYLISDNRRFVFLMVEPKESAAGGFTARRESIAAIRKAVSDLRSEFPGLAAGVTGQKALNNDEMLSAQNDTNIATVVSLVGITLLYLIFFKKVRHPLVIATTLMLGLGCTMGFITLTVGHLTIITVFVAPMLLGLADDFAVHFVARYEEERSRGQNGIGALRTVFQHTVPGIVAGAFTTSLAFFVVMLTDFRGIQELGWITGVGLMLYLLITLTFLPALLMMAEALRPWKAAEGGRTLLTGTFEGIGRLLARARWPLLALSGLLTLAALAAGPYVSFDYNLLNLQARGVESVTWEKRIIESSQRSSWKALSTAPTLEEAMRKADAFEALPAVESVESIASLIPGGQTERIELVRSLQPVLSDLPGTPGAQTPVDVTELQRTLDKLRLKVREDNEQWDPQKKPSERDLAEARQRLVAVTERLRTLEEDQARRLLERFQGPLFVDFQDKWSLLRNNLDPPGPITMADVPAQLKNRLISRDGTKYLLQIYPKKSIWDREPLEEFIGQLRQVDPDVAGSPIVGYESIRAMKQGYTEAGLYALIAVLVVTFITLRRVGDTVLAIIPLGIGMIWTAGWMWLFNLRFNLANLIAVPLIIGIGLENGIHIVHRFREEGEGGPALVASSTGQSVTLFSLTTMVGFGSLMVAKYYGIYSIGLLLTVSVGSVLVASLTVLPLLLFHPARKKPTSPPDTPLEKKT